MKALVTSILQQVRSRLPEPVRKVARGARAAMLMPVRSEEELKRLRAEVTELRETVRQMGDSMAESSAYWGRALDEVRDSLGGAAGGPGRSAADERAVAYAVRALGGPAERPVVLSLGGGDGSVERALAFLGHRVLAREPWPLLWSAESVETADAAEPWAALAAPARGLVAWIGPGRAGLPLEELSGCAPGTRLVLRCAGAAPPVHGAGWELQDVQGLGEGAGTLGTLVRR